MKKLFLLLTLAFSLMLNIANAQTSGSLDTTFGIGGKVITPVGIGIDYANAVVIQANGKIVAAGASNGNFGIVRYNTDGSLDNSFGTAGKEITYIGDEDEVFAVAIQNDGKIVAVGGYSYGGSNSAFAIVRYNTDGSLDNTFDTTGIVITPFGSDKDKAYAVAIQTDGKIVVAGYSFNGSNYDFAIVRYNTDGSLDNTFGTAGKITTDVGGGYDWAYAVAIQTDGKIIATGFCDNVSDEDFAIVRYNTDGSLDNTFGTAGKVITHIGGYSDRSYAVAIQTNGKIVVVGEHFVGSNSDFAIVRYNTDGSLDNTFGTAGIVITDVGSYNDYAYSVAIQTDEKIIAVGASNGNFVIVRYNDNCIFSITVDSTHNIECNGLSNGAVYTTVAGGTEPYTYSWTNTGQTTGDITLLGANTYNVTVTDSNGCTANTVATITEPAVLTIIIDSTQNASCNGADDGAVYTTTSGGTPSYTYDWSNGAGTTSDISNLSPNTYKVTVMDIMGCTATDSVEVNTSSFNASFTFSVDTLTGIATFTNTTTGSNKYYWVYDDGEYSNAVSPNHTYSNDGIYRVSLTATDTITGCQSKTEQDVKVKTNSIEPCYADYTYAIDTFTNTFTFTNISSSGMSRNYWEFGDGSLSNATSPVHQYTTAGYYTVSLMVIDTINNCFDSKRIGIIAGELSNPCKADFTYTVDLNTQEICFSDNSDAPANAKHLWDFNDGYLSTLTNPEHTYSVGGFYDVCLTIQDTGTNCINTSCQNLKASDEVDYCHAEFTYSVDTITGDVNFYDKSKGNHNGWVWTYGDGTNESKQHGKHKYNPGYYTVILQITDSVTGCTSYFVDVINVQQPYKLKAGFGYEKKEANTKASTYPVDFKGAAFGDPAMVAWDFGDDSTNTTSISPTHEYTAVGVYDVWFKIFNAIGECDSAYQQITIDEITDLTEYNLSSSISIYPNPANSKITIETTGAEKQSFLSMYNISGQEIIKQQITSVKTELDISNLPKGIYFIKVTNDKESFVKKVVVE